MQPPLLSFYADDFTGATDALEVLSHGGIDATLFTVPPTPQMLADTPGPKAFGVAGRSRAWTPAQMRETLPATFRAIAAAGARVLHYKVCSTFDSSPTVGSIGCVIEIARDLFGRRAVPVLAGAPDLGRYCAFGNLFARYGADGPVYRIDRHPSMSRHPVTPMDEADLRLHLARQTACSIGLFAFPDLDLPPRERAARFRGLCDEFDAVLVDITSTAQFAAVGQLIESGATSGAVPTFVVGSSAVESALCAHGAAGATSPVPPAAPARGPVLGVCGSCSPVTREQRRRAVEAGFAEVVMGAAGLDAGSAADAAAGLLRSGRSTIVAVEDRHGARSGDDVAHALAQATRQVVASGAVARLVVAGGDTSGAVADALGVESMRVAATLVRGAPLMRAVGPALPGGAVEAVFKGGQIGPADFFMLVQSGGTR